MLTRPGLAGCQRRHRRAVGCLWDQLNQMGLERLMEIYQEALDVYNSGLMDKYWFVEIFRKAFEQDLKAVPAFRSCLAFTSKIQKSNMENNR